MTKFDFDHVHLGSPNPEATVQYYVEMFGAEVFHFNLANGTPAIGIFLGGQKILVAQTSDEGDGMSIERNGAARGIDHFALTVNDSEQAINEFRSKGAEFALEPVEIGPRAWMTRIRGPEGVIVEVLQQKNS